jgi:hypothetical protein
LPHEAYARPAILRSEVAVRAYAPPERDRPRPRGLPPVQTILVPDVETRTDPGQALLFGSAQIRTAAGRLVKEVLFHGEVTPAERTILERYVAEHSAANGGRLELLDRRRFLREVVWPIAYKARARVVAFNLPFDAARLSYAWVPARNGGFTLHLFDSVDASGRVWPDRFRVTVRVKALDAKRNFFSFGSPAELDEELKEDGHVWAGRFLDAKTLAYAFTDRSLSLDAAAAEFDLEVRKGDPGEHGVLTEAYIDYNRQDVEVTWQLHQALVAEWDRHPIDLPPEQGYSPAALSKAYLAAAGITPPSERSDVGLDRLGQAMTAYYGGRTECRIRGVPMPVRYVDFASMYPTVFSLLGLWDWATARRLASVDATKDARALLDATDRAVLHDPAVWRRLAGVFCRVRPTGELLPVRARYGAHGADGEVDPLTGSLAWTIGLNGLHAGTDLWYTLADLFVARLLGGRAPEILEAFRVVPEGRLRRLRPIKLRGADAVDPRTTDLFRLATEARARVKADEGMTAAERRRLAQFLKTFANGGAYGIFAEVRQLDPVSGGRMVAVHGLDPLTARVTTPEEPGAYCFPPLAATVTGAARLLLGLLQADIEAAGGAYVACDTDSLLIVSSEIGGLIACPGGPERKPDGVEAVRALPWAEVGGILAGLEPLNLYAPGTVPALVKIEAENFASDDASRPVHLWAVAGSSKRYVLYEDRPDGVVLRKASEHGLGLYRNPMPARPASDPAWSEAWPEWVDVAWRRLIAEATGRPVPPAPPWFDHPAVSQLPVSSPHVIGPFRTFNEGQPYDRQVKPFGFVLLGHRDPLAALPDDVGADVTPVAPFSSNPEALLDLPWFNRRDGRPVTVTSRRRPTPGAVRLSTIGDIIARYRTHPEHKSGDPRGGLGRRGSVGLLPRLEVEAVGYPVHIGKESNRLEEVEHGLITDPDEVYVEYRDERREWEAMLPALRGRRDELGWRHLAERSGLSERAVRYALNAGRVPHEPARTLLLRLVRLGDTANIDAR